MSSLAKQVRDRERQIDRYTKFLIRFVGKHGQTIKEDVCANHTESIIVWPSEAGKAHGFQLRCHFGHTMFGGNNLEVRFNGSLVLGLYNQTISFKIKETQVQTYDQSVDWQKPFDHLIDNADEIAIQLAESAKKRQRRSKAKLNLSATESALKQKARRLGISTEKT